MPEQRTAPNLSTKHQIETHLHEKLEAARIDYESASEDYKRALKNCDELRRTNHSDGNGNDHSQHTVEHSVSQNVKSQRDAFEKYRRALDEFNKFILYGDLPDKSE